MTGASTQPIASGGGQRCYYCAARSHAPCGGLRDLANLERLEQMHSLPRRIASGKVVVTPDQAGDVTYTILRGWVALCDTLADGRSVILHFALPGDILPLELASGRPSRVAVAVGETIVCGLTRARHQILRREDALYDERYQQAVARELTQAYDHVIDVALSNATERVARLLWELATRSLRRRPTASDHVPAPLTQVQIGLATGLTAVHVSRTLRRLREEGLATFAGHAITIHDPAAVERLAGIGEETLAMWT